MGMLAGKTAVITGSTRGLGLAIARAFAAEGAAVVISSRSAEAVAQTVASFRASGYQAEGLAADVSKLEDVQALADLCLMSFNRMDIWVNNAGTTGPYGPTIQFEPRVFESVVQTNILGTYYGSLTALHHFRQQGSGKLINMLGMGYNKPAPWQNAYGSSKTWIRNFTRALAEENRDMPGVGVYALNPGMVLTDLLTRNDVIAGSEDRLKNFPTIVRMWAKPGEIPAREALRLASAATDGRTGLEGNVFTGGVLLLGAIREGWLRLIGRKPDDGIVEMRVVPAWQPDKSK
ncbi:MAG: SDR family oxidoreductase [Leptolinea sp.]|jgi:NAD(P)-dependent dehydrogenase (short-subunit alcohol dehydrogenase family)|nr:SDR family oxidoreductase [Leptolinea sp.]